MKKIKRGNLKFITYILILSIVIMLFLTGYSIGKSIMQINIKSQAQIARPILEVISNSNLEITDAIEEGECSFIVRNYNARGEVTETDLEYIVTVKDTISEKLKKTVIYELYKNGQKIELQNQMTKIMKLTDMRKQEDEYKLKVKYDRQASTEMTNILGKIQVQVHSEQSNTLI